MTARAMGRRKDGRGRNFFYGRLDMGGRGLIGIGEHGDPRSVGWTHMWMPMPTMGACVHILVVARGGRGQNEVLVLECLCAYIEVCMRRLWVRSTLVILHGGLCASSMG